MKSALWLCFFLALTLATRCANHADVFVGGNVYFIDADCYSRMTRVRMVMDAPGTIIRHHDFENYPEGISSHATAPFDYLIAVLAWMLKPFTKYYVDLAGAIISPLLGVMTTGFLWYWSRELLQRYRRLMLLLVSLSPILVHGTNLGRPDHQSLLIFLMTVALAAELAQARDPSVKWSTIAGAAWGLGLWVSLYEPLILMATILVTKLLFFRAQLFSRARLRGHVLLLAIVAVALLIERWHMTLPDATMLHYFGSWKQQIGEMSPMWKLSPGSIFQSLLFSWVGFGLFAAPLLLIARIRDAKRSILLLALLAVTFTLTITQVRWGYFFALVFAMSLPWQLSLFRKQWLVWPLFILSLWPVLRDWDGRLFPDEARVVLLTQKRQQAVALRDVAEHLRMKETVPLLAPWWISPPLVYWSGQPAIAGSAHEGLSGIVDSARFFTASNFADAHKILEKRAVGAIVIGDPGPIVESSAELLFQPLPTTTVTQMLYERPHIAPGYLSLVYANQIYKVFAVNQSATP